MILYSLTTAKAVRTWLIPRVQLRLRGSMFAARQQMLFHLLQNDALEGVWSRIQEAVQEPGLQQFAEAKLLVQGKSLKTLKKGET